MYRSSLISSFFNQILLFLQVQITRKTRITYVLTQPHSEKIFSDLSKSIFRNLEMSAACYSTNAGLTTSLFNSTLFLYLQHFTWPEVVYLPLSHTFYTITNDIFNYLKLSKKTFLKISLYLCCQRIQIKNLLIKFL